MILSTDVTTQVVERLEGKLDNVYYFEQTKNRLVYLMGENRVSVYVFITDTITIAKVFDHTVAYGDIEFSLEYKTWDFADLFIYWLTNEYRCR